MFKWTNRVYLFYTPNISVDLAHHKIFPAKVGNGRIIIKSEYLNFCNSPLQFKHKDLLMSLYPQQNCPTISQINLSVTLHFCQVEIFTHFLNWCFDKQCRSRWCFIWIYTACQSIIMSVLKFADGIPEWMFWKKNHQATKKHLNKLPRMQSQLFMYEWSLKIDFFW